MIVCKNTPQTKLQWLVSGWNATEQAYNQLSHIVGKDIASFGKCQIGSGMMQWSFADQGLQPYNSLDESKQQQCLTLLDELFKRVKRAFGSDDKGHSDAVCTIPSYDYLFLSMDGTIVYVAAWGYKLLGQKKFDPLEQHLPIDIKHPVKIAFTDDGHYVPNRLFSIKNALTINEYKTDANGIFLIGEKVEPGKVIQITDLPSSKSFTITVDKKQELYLLDITEEKKDPPTPPTPPEPPILLDPPFQNPDKKKDKPQTVRIGLHNFDGEPLKNIKVQITTKKGVYDVVTDKDGNVWLPKENFPSRKKVGLKFTYMPIDKK